MGVEYFHLAPVILNDAVWAEYAPPCFASGTFAQRHGAFLTAEQQMIQWLNTPLLPTSVTGTYRYPHPYEPTALDFVRVKSIDSIVAHSIDAGCTCDLTDNAACAFVRDGKYGIIDFRVIGGAFVSQCGCQPGLPYDVEVAFTAGLPTGVAATDVTLHMALAHAATLVLNEMADPGANEGGAGDAGVVGWGAQGYSEQRIPPTSFAGLRKTPFGSSAKANWIADRVEHLRLSRPLRL